MGCSAEFAKIPLKDPLWHHASLSSVSCTQSNLGNTCNQHKDVYYTPCDPGIVSFGITELLQSKIAPAMTWWWWFLHPQPDHSCVFWSRRILERAETKSCLMAAWLASEMPGCAKATISYPDWSERINSSKTFLICLFVRFLATADLIILFGTTIPTLLCNSPFGLVFNLKRAVLRVFPSL